VHQQLVVMSVELAAEIKTIVRTYIHKQTVLGMI